MEGVGVVANAVNAYDLSSIPEDYVKLFVGQLPLALDQDGVKKVFSEFGAIEDVYILRDRLTKASKGAGFVKFTRRSDADRAIAALHNKVSLDQVFVDLQLSCQR
jgi:RNA recognition motif-containing protein